MGLLLPTQEGILIEDFILVKQEVGTAHVSLDMDWWADKQIELYDKQGIEPWRTSCWTHTHPAGINRPSTTDEQTMAESFGGWDFILMLILTKDGQFYVRMDCDHDFGNGTKQRLSVPCNVTIDWSNPGKEAITESVIQQWEQEFKDCVQETAGGWFAFEDADNNGRRASKKSRTHGLQKAPQRSSETHTEEEIEEYVQACHNMGYDPNDPEHFADYFGYEPLFEL